MSIVNSQEEDPPKLRTGIWQDMPSTSVSRCLAMSGWDFVVLDIQHGAMSFETAYECIHAIHPFAGEAWVRVGIGTPFQVQRALDIGADAVVVPMVNSTEVARELARAAKYPPVGTRSVGGDCSIFQGKDYVERANEETKLLIQVEHVDSALNADEIMSIDGVDGCFVGPVDLALSMNLSRHDYSEDEGHRALIQKSLDACQNSKKLACCNCYSYEDVIEKISIGFQCITFQSEVNLLIESGRDLYDQINAIRIQHKHDVGIPKPKHPLLAESGIDKKQASNN